ncbi:hypothetical protein FH039_11545 [Thermococcus indicus]|uniref:Uncharacterized protein n=1 Tax=Thermococcus indicus TaxID=2586643 RepID=A0A4Y5SPB7_9EURY|nr:hypothetical protein [Thermococcus indicus]QDA32565.1 hypothetical protein FH039_11545 [Thermococcus indicus]
MKKLVFALLAVALLVIAAGCENPDTNVKTEKTLTINDVTVHYSGDVSLSQAKALIDFVGETFQITGETDVYLAKSGDAYIVEVTTPYTSPDQIDDATKFYVKMMASKMSQDVFGGSKSTLKLVTDERDELFSAESRYSYVNSGTIYVWYADAGEDKAKAVLDYAVSLVGEGPWDIILEGSDPYDVKAVSSFESRDEIGDAENAYRQMASDLSQKLGGDVVVHVLNPKGKEIAAFSG